MPAGAETFMLSEWISIKDTAKCDLPEWERALVQGHGFHFFYVYEKAAIEPLLRLVGPSMWRGYDEVGNEFGAATNAKQWFTIQFSIDETWSSQAMIEFHRNEYGVFCFWFTNMRSFADKKGEHEGVHPCAVIEVPRNYIELWLAQVAGK